MKKAIKKYLTQLHENEEKGFSLVELIIVMAIMAILVGVVASQVIPYMEKSRQSKDQQQLSGLVTDITAAIASSAVTVQNSGGGATPTIVELTDANLKALAVNPSGSTAESDKLEAEFASLRSVTAAQSAIDGVKEKLKSKGANQSGKTPEAKKISDGKIYMKYDANASKMTLFMSSSNSEANAISKLTVESE